MKPRVSGSSSWDAAGKEKREQAGPINRRLPRPPEIKSFLDANNLTLIGFAGIDTREFRRRNPDDEALRDLDLWHAFETENPTTFVGMYQFWVQKP